MVFTTLLSVLLFFAAVTPSLDIVCLQETNPLPRLSFSRGFLTLTFKLLEVTSLITVLVSVFYINLLNISHFETDNSVRYTVVDFKSTLHDFRVICIYASNHYLERGPFFEDLSRFSNCNIPVFLLGDFNSVFDCSLDRSDSPIVSSPRDTSDKLKKLFVDFNVVNVWRSLRRLSHCQIGAAGSLPAFAPHTGILAHCFL